MGRTLEAWMRVFNVGAADGADSGDNQAKGGLQRMTTPFFHITQVGILPRIFPSLFLPLFSHR